MLIILFNGAETFVNTPSMEGLMCNAVKISQAISEKKTFKEYTGSYFYIAQGHRQITPEAKL